MSINIHGWQDNGIMKKMKDYCHHKLQEVVIKKYGGDVKMDMNGKHKLILEHVDVIVQFVLVERYKKDIMI